MSVDPNAAPIPDPDALQLPEILHEVADPEVADNPEAFRMGPMQLAFLGELSEGGATQENAAYLQERGVANVTPGLAHAAAEAAMQHQAAVHTLSLPHAQARSRKLFGTLMRHGKRQLKELNEKRHREGQDSLRGAELADFERQVEHNATQGAIGQATVYMHSSEEKRKKDLGPTREEQIADQLWQDFVNQHGLRDLVGSRLLTPQQLAAGAAGLREAARFARTHAGAHPSRRGGAQAYAEGRDRAHDVGSLHDLYQQALRDAVLGDLVDRLVARAGQIDPDHPIDLHDAYIPGFTPATHNRDRIARIGDAVVGSSAAGSPPLIAPAERRFRGSPSLPAPMAPRPAPVSRSGLVHPAPASPPATVPPLPRGPDRPAAPVPAPAPSAPVAPRGSESGPGRTERIPGEARFFGDVGAQMAYEFGDPAARPILRFMQDRGAVTAKSVADEFRGLTPEGAARRLAELVNITAVKPEPDGTFTLSTQVDYSSVERVTAYSYLDRSQLQAAMREVVRIVTVDGGLEEELSLLDVVGALTSSPLFQALPDDRKLRYVAAVNVIDGAVGSRLLTLIPGPAGAYLQRPAFRFDS